MSLATGTNSSPNFTQGGNVFGRTAPQWNQYFRAKVDAESGYSTLQSLVDPTISGGTADFDSLTVNGTGVIGIAGALPPLSISGGTLQLGYDSSLQVTAGTLGVAPTQTLGTLTLNGSLNATGGLGFTLALQTATITGTLSTANGGLGNFRLSGSGSLTVSGTANALRVNGSLVLGGTATVTFSTSGTVGTVGTAQAGQIPGTSTNDSASAGNIGEFVSGTGTISLSNATPQAFGSINLTAGDWDVCVITTFLPSGSTSVTAFVASIATTSGTLNTSLGFETIWGQASSVPGTAGVTLNVGPSRVLLSGSATYYGTIQSNFGVSTMTANGIIRARRVR